MRLSRPDSPSKGPLELVSAEPRQPAAGELLVRIAACAVCRTDLQLCEGSLSLHRRPIVPGHQFTGTVAALGAQAEGWREGDRAGGMWLASACGACARCREGRENLCEAARFNGWDCDGGYATHAFVRADFALRIPPVFDDASAAPLLCGGVIGYRALKMSGVRAGQRLGLFGFGASALLTLQAACHMGCRVFVCTRSERERRRARSLGAEWAGGYDDAPPLPLDAAITFAPVGTVVVSALKALDRGGTVVVNAIHLDGIPAFDYADLWWERSIRSVANVTRSDAREFLDLAARIPIRPEFEVHRLEQANLALERLQGGMVSGAAVLLC